MLKSLHNLKLLLKRCLSCGLSKTNGVSSVSAWLAASTARLRKIAIGLDQLTCHQLCEGSLLLEQVVVASLFHDVPIL